MMGYACSPTSRGFFLLSVGHIHEIWHYPVSSIGGEALPSADIDRTGIVGDRHYALVDRETGLPAAPESDLRWRKALYLQARTVEGELPVISFPHGESFAVMDREMNECLSDHFGFAAAIAAYAPGDQHPGIMLTQPRHEHHPLHVMTTQSLAQLATLRQTDTVDVRRFRPSVLVTMADDSGFVESGWIGRSLQMGPIALQAEEETRRCGMTFIAQPDLEEDPDILRSILRHNKRHLGIYCSVTASGTIAVGDHISIE
jgi:uncharacterized protein YcbX